MKLHIWTISSEKEDLDCSFWGSLSFKPTVVGCLLTHSHTVTPFDAPGKQAFWKHCGKRRNCSLRAISPFPTVFSTHLDNFLPFSSNLKLSSANSFNLEESKILSSVTHFHTMTPFDAPGKQTFWKHCGKRRNCLLRAISPFPTVFSTHLDNFLPFSSNLK